MFVLLFIYNVILHVSYLSSASRISLLPQERPGSVTGNTAGSGRCYGRSIISDRNWILGFWSGEEMSCWWIRIPMESKGYIHILYICSILYIYMYIHGVYAYKARGTVAESPVTLGWFFKEIANHWPTPLATRVAKRVLTPLSHTSFWIPMSSFAVLYFQYFNLFWKAMKVQMQNKLKMQSIDGLGHLEASLRVPYMHAI